MSGAPCVGALLEAPGWGGRQRVAVALNLLQGSSLGLNASEAGGSSCETSGC